MVTKMKEIAAGGNGIQEGVEMRLIDVIGSIGLIVASLQILITVIWRFICLFIKKGSCRFVKCPFRMNYTRRGYFISRKRGVKNVRLLRKRRRFGGDRWMRLWKGWWRRIEGKKGEKDGEDEKGFGKRIGNCLWKQGLFFCSFSVVAFFCSFLSVAENSIWSGGVMYGQVNILKG